MSIITKPMLAGTLHDEDISRIEWPMYGSPKVDGIRTLIHPDLGPVTRSFKPLPNELTRDALKRIAGHSHLDGELLAVDKNGVELSFNETQSALMSHSGRPLWAFRVFDCFMEPTAPYEERLNDARVIVTEMNYATIKMLPQVLLKSAEELEEFTSLCISEGYEGVCLRSPSGPYKNGRSTLRQGWLLKYKEWQDAEGLIIGFEELMRNENEDVKDNFGYAKRSSAKDGLVPAGTLGALILKTEWGELRVGTGFDSALRDEIWRRNMDTEERYRNKDLEPPDLGRTVTFKYQAFGMQDKPRFPVFKGFRGNE